MIARARAEADLGMFSMFAEHGLHKKGLTQEERQFFAPQQHAENNGRHPSERVK